VTLAADLKEAPAPEFFYRRARRLGEIFFKKEKKLLLISYPSC
jgi:hypothetical protein